MTAPGTDSAPLLERDAELDAGRRLVTGVFDRDGGTLLIEGPPGIGKSRIAHSVEEEARRYGARTLTARGLELEMGYAFGVVRQLLDEVVAQTDPELLYQGAAARARSVFDPAASDPAPAPGFATLHALYWVVETLADDRPTILVVDDAHWADSSSLAFLAFLAARIAGTATGLVVAARGGGVADDWRSAVTGAENAQVVRPAPLSKRAVAQLAQRLTGGRGVEELAADVHRATGGNALFATELLRAAARGGVDTLDASAVSRSVMQRIEVLGDDVTAVARHLAVLGPRATITDIGDLADMDRTRATRAVDDLQEAGILAAGSHAFVHPVIADAVVEALPAHERARRHSSAAAMLHRKGAPAERVAAHLLACPPDGDAAWVGVLREAAAGAMRRGAPEEAVALLRRALEEGADTGDHASLLRELGMAEMLTGRPEAADTLADALRATPPGPANVMTARLLAAMLMVSGRGPEAVDVLEAALADVDGDVARVVEAEMLFCAMLDARTTARARPRLQDRPEPSDDTPGGRLLLAAMAHWSVISGAPAKRIAALARRALAGGQLLYDQVPDSPAFWMATNALAVAGFNDERRPLVNAGIDDAVRRGSLLGLAVGLGQRAGVSYGQGRLAEAEDDARRALDHALAVGFRGIVPVLHGLLILIALETDGPDAADTALERSQLSDLAAGPALDSIFMEARARLHVEAGRPEHALVDLRALQERDELFSQWPRLAVMAHLAMGEHDRAAVVAAHALGDARRHEAPLRLGAALRATASVSETDAAIELLDEAVAMYRDCGYRLELAHTVLERGVRRRRGGSVAAARRDLAEALDLAGELGAVRLEERAARELASFGGYPVRRARTGIAALTASERRVAAMAADGLSNRDIAQRLFVTTKTVELHLTNAYRKLEIRSRADLPVTLSAESLQWRRAAEA